ncbi:TPA: hypothetical protein OUJ00_004556 [Escherichia coli]|nr:hypothetical protein [Escherichia coli]
MKRFIFFMAWGCFAGYSYSANTYSYLWVTTNNSSGDISYSGKAVGYVSGTVNQLYTGIMKVAYVDCSTTEELTVDYRAEDRWIFVPNTIKIRGVSIPITVDVLPSEYKLINSDFGGFLLLKQNGSTYGHTQRGRCGSGSYPINYTYPSFSLKMNVSSLTSGSYTGTILIKMAYAEYFGIYSSDITKFSDNLAFQYTSNSEIPYSINIINKCNVSTSEIELNHGELNAGVADGHSVSSNISITCDDPASLKLMVVSRTKPEKLYHDGVGVGLNNGWDSVLQIGNSGISDYSLTGKTISVPTGYYLMPITSTLKRNGTTISAGDISGNVVFSMEMD